MKVNEGQHELCFLIPKYEIQLYILILVQCLFLFHEQEGHDGPGVAHPSLPDCVV